MAKDDASLVNYTSSFESQPNKLILLDGNLYAFICDDDNSFGLWMKPVDEYMRDDWCEVSDLTMVAVFVYQRLKKIAVEIGWILPDSDLFV